MKKVVIFLAVVGIFVAAILVYQKIFNVGSEPPTTPTMTQDSIIDQNTEDVPAVTTLVENLDTPWALAFLPASRQGGPDKTLLVTERNGRLSLITDKGISQVATIDKSTEYGEGGLMGITLHPNFGSNNYIYLYYTFFSDNDKTMNRVVRYKLTGNTLYDEQIIVDNIPGGIYHNGGRIKFGSDGYLYITTGDSTNPSLSQDRNSLAGKILRVTDAGDPAPANPFRTRIFSYGHRNPQGITWDSAGNLWSTEHGRSGAQSGLDELNLIESGKNYGWPNFEGDETGSGITLPVLHSGPNVTWAPGGIAYLNNKLYFVGLRGETLYVYDLATRTLSEFFKGEYGRLRDVIVGPDNLLYITTSNRDGRGNPQETNDKIIRINPSKL